MSKINWQEVQKLYDTGKTIAECGKHFGFNPDTARKARQAGLFVVRDKSACQPSVVIDSQRIEQLVKAYELGSSWHELISSGFKQAEYSFARKTGLLTPRTTAEQASVRIKKFGPNRPGPEACEALSIRQSLQNSGGRCKWFEVAGQKVQGTWERDIASKFEVTGIKWIKPKVHKDVIRYDLDGSTRSYTPDFYLPDFDIYLEVKGHRCGNDTAKMDAVISQHPDKKILIVEKDGYEAIMQGKQIW